VTETFDETHVRLMLIRYCDRMGSQHAFAQYYGLSDPFVGSVILGKRSPGTKILAALGFAKVTRYIRKPAITSGESPRVREAVVP
jgi:hypothetical protein